MACSHISNCALYPKISLSSALKVWQVFYCEGDFSKCVRYQTSTEGKPVPDTLLPNGKNLDLAEADTGSASDAGSSDSMVTAMKAEVENESAGPALNDLQSAIDTMSDGKVETKMPDVIDEAGLIFEEPDTEPMSGKPDNPAVTSGPTSSYYLRMRAEDKTGVMSSIIQVLGRHNVSVDAMAQKKFSTSQSDTVMMIVTGQASPDKISVALEDLADIAEINGQVISIPLEFLDEGMFS